LRKLAWGFGDEGIKEGRGTSLEKAEHIGRKGTAATGGKAANSMLIREETH
jgi:hypothetical protein